MENRQRGRDIIKEKRYSRNWIGKKFITNRGEVADVIDGGSKNSFCTIKIGDWEDEVLCGKLKNGNIKNPYYPSIYGKGYLGVGIYKPTNKGKMNKSYHIWHDMLERCYDEKHHLEHPSYVGCSVDNSWLCFQVFAKWHEENYQDLNNIKLELDKDLMIKGNKLYSPNTCKLIPKYANLFLANNLKQNGDYVGFHWNKGAKKYQSQITDITSHKRIYLGCFDNKEDASRAYILERKNQSVKMYHKLTKDGFADVEVLNKFKSGDL